MTIHFATDHAGFERKNEIIAFVRDDLGYAVIDHGAETFDADDDYPDYIARAAVAVSQNPYEERAIIFGGSGQGEAMVANKYPHVRATVFYGGDSSLITLSREHNNANVLSIGARFVSVDAAKEAVRVWLATPFTGDERHVRRIEKIEALDI
jgi:ribose 5-phosphate isomerase B